MNLDCSKLLLEEIDSYCKEVADCLKDMKKAIGAVNINLDNQGTTEEKMKDIYSEIRKVFGENANVSINISKDGASTRVSYYK